MDLICVNSSFPSEALAIYAKYGVIVPEEGKMYNLRDIVRTTIGKTGILLEEIKNPKIPILHPVLGTINYEPNWDSSRFTNLDGTPLNAKELEQIIKKHKQTT